jgi:hypothetical protein
VGQLLPKSHQSTTLAIEIGRVDIHISVSLLSQYLAAPRKGHLERVFGIFAWLKRWPNSKIVFDPAYIQWDNRFKDQDWEDFFKDAVEPVPDNAPEARGKEMQINVFVECGQQSDQKVTHRDPNLLQQDTDSLVLKETGLH